MYRKTLARELARGRLAELDKMKKMLEMMHSSLGKILAVQLKFQELIKEDEERGYELQADSDEDEAVQGGVLSFRGLLDMAVNRLKG
ncbi:hypothetical protein GQ600_12647 [Phytophthora cactorum]|nr:hypothetical protein GQ600_12647 [Phytophthora cactorum]